MQGFFRPLLSAYGLLGLSPRLLVLIHLHFRALRIVICGPLKLRLYCKLRQGD